LNILVFLLSLNRDMILQHVQGILLILFGLVYSVINSLFMWITWIDRFSGNANFFFFQVIVYNAFLVILYSQLFKAVDKTRKHYERKRGEKQNKKRN